MIDLPEEKGFNSMIVRLKVTRLEETPKSLDCFNSMIVRLKEGIAVEDLKNIRVSIL